MRDDKNVLLVTGNAGFIGMHVALRASQLGYSVLGIDDVNDYYDVQLKLARLAEQGIDPSQVLYGKTVIGDKGIGFIKGNVEDRELIERVFSENSIVNVIHLAAQAGVRYSIDNPSVYLKSNIVGFFNILEACRKHVVKHLLYASSSSVYGMNKSVPFKVTDNVDHPISLYAATKKSNELMAHTYSHLFGIPSTGLRFFTVYGPWGRPDMALFKFTKNILEGKQIEVYNNGDMSRDFTFIDDIVESVLRVLELPPAASEGAPYRICNIGRNEPVSLSHFITAIENATGQKAIRNNMPLQPGDVLQTFADVSALTEITGYAPKMDVDQGVKEFVNWYRVYYGV
ncbi:MAG: NAD-dependent epimerase/dehydratase family protein [Flavobacteriales bacterium]|nr:NAD-dependent epimerase/dehydratase family protein [Flavobacteriales bacterium]